ncbi:hypothetical protein A9G34_03240 [Gilliamella sp. Choc4-2]|jgi:hypothetical protein|uniref:hypothetical protein n=2 Tax=Gilliamella TaxID=1193503 RepID=UPI000555721D|nr:hypothetical protein [Gilliamella apicola]OCG32802.1 hypothetical protein A9G33_02560 [Gilliamella apicola]OCG47102.1 hypothetical protein A9G34_03240 [Gilliamella apicola]OCG56588.1 hypothetical protein A9G36_02880 [Gilliamella apicola]
MSKIILVIICLIIILLIMFSFLKPKFYIKSYEEDDHSLNLNIYSQSKECGFISINEENIIFQYSLKLVGKKGLINIRDAKLYFNKDIFIIKNEKYDIIVSIKCNEEIYNKAMIYFNIKKQKINDSKNKSKRDLFFEN